MPAKDSLNIPLFMETVTNWAKIIFLDYNEALVEKTDNTVEYSVTLKKVGETSGMYHASTVNATSFYKIEAKPDRIRVTFKVKHYKFAKANLKGTKAMLILPSQVFPYTDSGDTKSFARAFLNCHVKLIESLSGFIDYINNRYEKLPEKKKVDDNW